MLRALFEMNKLPNSNDSYRYSNDSYRYIIEILLIVGFLTISLLRVNGCGMGRTIAKEPGIDAKAALKLGDELYEKWLLADAAVMYWDALKKEPKLVEPRVKLASIYYQNHWSEDAKSMLDEALKQEPSNVQARLLRGKILRLSGESEEAEKEYLLALKAEPSSAEAYYYLGSIYHASQIYEKAIEEYKLAMAYDTKFVKSRFEPIPFGLQARLGLARVYRQNGEVDNAIATLSQAVSLDPNYQEAKDELIELLKTKAESLRSGPTRDYVSALEGYEQIVKLNPKEVDAWVEIGKIYEYLIEDYQKALEAFQKAYQLDPTHPDVILHLKNLQNMMKK